MLPAEAVLGLKLVAIEPLLDEEPESAIARSVALPAPPDPTSPRPRA